MDALVTAQARTSGSFRGATPPDSLVTPSAIGPVAEFLGVPFADAEALVKKMEEESSWERGPGEGTAL